MGKSLDASRGDFAPRPFGPRMSTSGGPPAAHAPSHEVGGLDALDLGSIVGVIDDTQHGNRGGGSLHPVVLPDPGGVAGFMDPADKAKLDGIGPAAARQADILFGRTVSVPAGGTLVLWGPGNSQAGSRAVRAGTITGASIQVNASDAVRSYDLRIRVNGAVAGILVLPAGSSGAQTAALAIAVVAGDIISAIMVRIAGAGGSTFTDELATIEVTY